MLNLVKIIILGIIESWKLFIHWSKRILVTALKFVEIMLNLFLTVILRCLREKVRNYQQKMTAMRQLWASLLVVTISSSFLFSFVWFSCSASLWPWCVVSRVSGTILMNTTQTRESGRQVQTNQSTSARFMRPSRLRHWFPRLRNILLNSFNLLFQKRSRVQMGTGSMVQQQMRSSPRR